MTSLSNSSSVTPTEYTLGFNFDALLVEELCRKRYQEGLGRVTEVFGALGNSPISSARPAKRIPSVDRRTFAGQVATLKSAGIAFNYLMNTSQPINRRIDEVLLFLSTLVDDGITRLTVGTTELATLVKTHFPQIHVTMSITYGVKNEQTLANVVDAGCDATYLDGVFVNRNFGLLRSLLAGSPIDIRLYANMSCIAACPVVRQHYDTFANQTDKTELDHDGFFAGCSLIKLQSPVEWIQMPWIRPEDIPIYREMGVGMFKLSDRLAPTPVLLKIADAYTSGQSPSDLFDIIERSGAKYRNLTDPESRAPACAPYYVDSTALPKEFMQHFIDGKCISHDGDCPICRDSASVAITRSPNWSSFDVSDAIAKRIPPALALRASRLTGQS